MALGMPLMVSLAGGWDSLTKSLSAIGPDFTGWSYGWVDLVGFGLAALCAPVFLMRFYAMRDDRTCQRGAAIAISFTLVTIGAVAVIGMCMRVLYPRLSLADNASTMFATQALPRVLGALVLTAVVAAVLSTVDSVLLVAGPAISHDLYGRLLRPHSTEKSRMKINRISTVIVGAVPILLTVAKLDLVQFIVLAYAALLASRHLPPYVVMVDKPGRLYWSEYDRTNIRGFPYR